MFFAISINCQSLAMSRQLPNPELLIRNQLIVNCRHTYIYISLRTYTNNYYRYLNKGSNKIKFTSGFYFFSFPRLFANEMLINAPMATSKNSSFFSISLLYRLKGKGNVSPKKKCQKNERQLRKTTKDWCTGDNSIAHGLLTCTACTSK